MMWHLVLIFFVLQFAANCTCHRLFKRMNPTDMDAYYNPGSQRLGRQMMESFESQIQTKLMEKFNAEMERRFSQAGQQGSPSGGLFGGKGAGPMSFTIGNKEMAESALGAQNPSAGNLDTKSPFPSQFGGSGAPSVQPSDSFAPVSNMVYNGQTPAASPPFYSQQEQHPELLSSNFPSAGMGNKNGQETVYPEIPLPRHPDPGSAAPDPVTGSRENNQAAAVPDQGASQLDQKLETKLTPYEKLRKEWFARGSPSKAPTGPTALPKKNTQAGLPSFIPATSVVTEKIPEVIVEKEADRTTETAHYSGFSHELPKGPVDDRKLVTDDANGNRQGRGLTDLTKRTHFHYL